MDMKKAQSGADSDAAVSRVVEAAGAAPAGHEGRIKKNMSMLAIVGFGLEVSNGWSGISGTLIVGLSQGGAATIIYGLIFTGIMNMFIAVTLAELSSAMPSAGGQYVWASVLAPAKFRRQISFATGAISIFAWIVISASVYVIHGTYMMSLAQLWNPSIIIERYQVFLIYIAMLILSVLYNIFLAVRVPWVGTAFIFVSTIVFLAIVISCVAAAPSYQPSSSVWQSYSNDIGWESAFVVVSTGLINPAYCYLGLDSSTHLAEDSLRPTRDIPIGLICTVLTSFTTAFATALALLYTIQDLDAILASYVPFLTIMAQATRSDAAATVLFVLTILAFVVAGNACLQSSSRLLWSLACDDAVPFARHLAHVSPRWNVPVLATIVPAIPVALVGVLYVASTTAYNSIIGSAIILSYLSFTVPTICSMLSGRKLGEERWFSLGKFGWVANTVVVIWCLFASVMWLFPLTSAPDGATMNYAIVVLGIMAVLSLLDWFLYARHHFHGPTSDEWVARTYADQALEAFAGGADSSGKPSKL